MAGRYAIETIFKLIDNITTPLDKIAGKGSKVGKVMKRDFVAAQESVDNFGKKLKSIGGYALAAGVGAVGVGIGIAAKQFIDFDDAITAATAKFKDLDVTSETYAESLKKVGQAARDVAAITEYNAVDTAGALDKMAMAGLTSEQSMKLLMGTTNLATAAGMDLTTAVDIATDSLGAFGLLSEDASQLQVNLDRVSDVMAKTTNMFNTDMPGMFESIKKGGPAFTAAGQSIETFSSLIGVMASSGVKGSEAGTQLRNMMLSLANPAEKAEKQLERLGIVTKDSRGNYLDVIDIIGQFEDATKNMGSAEKAAALSTIFGSRAVTGMNILLQEGSGKLRDYRTQLENAGGAAANIAEAMRGSIKNKIEVLKSALMELGFKFVEVFQEKGAGLIEKLTDAIENFDPQPFIDAVVFTGDAITGIIKIAGEFKDLIFGLAIAWGTYKLAMLGAAAAGPIIDFIQVIKTLKKSQEGLNIVTLIYHGLMKTHPVGLIITAIGILIGLIIACEGKIQRLAGVFQVVGMVLAAVFLPALAAISPLLAPIVFFIGFIASMISEVISNWGMLVETFKTDGIIAGLKRLGGVLLSGLLMPIQGLLELLAKIPGVGKFLGPAVDQMQAFRNQLKGIESQAEDIAELAASPPAASAPSVVPPAITNPVPEFPAAPGVASMSQPALLNLYEGRLFRAGPVLQSPAPDFTGPESPQITQAAPARIIPPAVEAVSVPVTYNFPELMVPPELIKPVFVQVQWIYPPPSDTPDTRTTMNTRMNRGITRTASAISRGGSRQRFYPAIPAAAGRIVPRPVEYPVAPSVGAALTSPASPMTRAEQTAAEQVLYSKTENHETITVKIAPEKGLEAKVVNPPKSPNVKLEVSGTV
jgi:TP901 family phage tail tape measure protein